jgi:hypothetical protein
VELLCVRFVKAQLYEITGADARVMMAAIVMLAAAAFVAAIIPARRAASIDPMQALRTESYSQPDRVDAHPITTRKLPSVDDKSTRTQRLPKPKWLMA